MAQQDGPAPAAEAMATLVRILDLERLEDRLFRGQSPDTTVQRVFGGQVAGQALVAAGRTVAADRPVHSLHAYFLRPGDPAVPIVYDVERVRDGRSFSTRRVNAVQHGRPIFALTASFALAAAGPEQSRPMPAVPDPESLLPLEQRVPALGLHWRNSPRPIDLRYVGDPPVLAADAGPGGRHSQVWLRSLGPLPDDPLVHVCALAYASDMTLLDTILLWEGLSPTDPRLQMASIDHAMWFHRPFRVDEWLLYEQEAQTLSAERGLALGRIYRRDGVHVCTVVQEGLLRLGEPDTKA